MNAPAEPAAPVSPTDDQGLRCPACDYDLRGLSSENCPECGLPIVRGALIRSTIPWTYRHQIGWLRAYRQTVWLTIRHTKKLAANVAGPVSLDDARRFRRATVLIAYVPLLLLGIWAYIAATAEWTWAEEKWPYAAPIVLGMKRIVIVAMAACLWLFLFCASGVASYFFHPGRLPTARQNRAVALSYYACAPLAGLPAFALFTAVFTILNIVHMESTWIGLAVAMMICAAAPLIYCVYWSASVRLLRHSTACGLARRVALAFYLPVAWFLLGAIFLFVLPCVLIGICIVIFSLK